MTCTLAVGVALAVAFVPSLVPHSRGPADGTVTVPISVYANGTIVVPVFIAGTGPYRFLLDTGSTRSAVSARLARKLRSPVVARTSVITPAGGITRNVTTLPALQIAHSPSVAIAAMVLPDEALRRGVTIDGLVGQDVLAGRAFTIDYRRRELVWHHGGTDQIAGHRLPLTEAHGLQFVALPSLAGTSGPARLLVDSGADALVLFTSAGRPVPAAVRLDAGVLRTSAGVQLGQHIRLDELDLGAFTLRNQSALLLPEPDATGLLGDGLLPLHLFARVTFDAAAGVLIVAAR
jgi:predicted aspartyl protease